MGKFREKIDYLDCLFCKGIVLDVAESGHQMQIQDLRYEIAPMTCGT